MRFSSLRKAIIFQKHKNKEIRVHLRTTYLVKNEIFFAKNTVDKTKK